MDYLTIYQAAGTSEWSGAEFAIKRFQAKSDKISFFKAFGVDRLGVGELGKFLKSDSEEELRRQLDLFNIGLNEPAVLLILNLDSGEMVYKASWVKETDTFAAVIPSFIKNGPKRKK